MHKLMTAVLCAFALCTTAVAAQESHVRQDTKTAVHNGKKITATGCVEQASDGLILADVRGGATHSYLLVGKDHDLAKHVGERVQVTGKAADRGNGKIRTETKTKTEGGKEETRHAKAEGDLTMPVLGVESVKTVAKTCS